MRVRRRRGRLERLFYERVAADHRRWPHTSAEDCPEDGYWFDREAADRIVRFFRDYCRHFKGEWAGDRLELAPWQKVRLREVFGWKRPDGTRRFREAYNEVPRKNGKSTEAAGVGNYTLTADGEPGAEVYSAATKRDQAKIIWGAAHEMVRRSPALKKRVTLRPGSNNMSVAETASKFEPLGRDSDTLDGLNPHCVLIDETHAHKDRGIYDVLTSALGARRQPLMYEITTAGVYDPTTIGWELHDFAVKVLDGTLTADWFFAFIAAADEGDDWSDPATWAKANPNYGISVDPDYLRREHEKAAARPSAENNFRRYHLNQWVEQSDRWISIERWNEAPVGLPETEVFTGFGGLDLASKQDIAAFVAVFPDADEGYDLLCRFWVPEGAVARAEQTGRVPYAAWVREGHMIATEGEVIDYATVEADVLKVCEEHDIQRVGYDPWNAENSRQRLVAEGLEMVEMRQGVRTMAEPTAEVERLVTARKIRHNDHPVLKWMASNVAVRMDSNGNIKPDRSRSTGKIDGMVALIMAVGVAMRIGPTKPSRYEQEGAEVFHI